MASRSTAENPPAGAALRARAGERGLAEQVLERLARAGRFRDEETAEHVERVSRCCAFVARRLGWDAEACADLRAAAALHDIGKIGIPDAVLRKPGKLTPEERACVEEHAQIGHDILTGSDDPVMQLAAMIALTHHERPDGTGYPRRLRGDAIPLPGQIASVADVFDALTHDRVYRAAYPVDKALEILCEGSGSQFDPAVLRALEAVLPEVQQVQARYRDAADPAEPAQLFFGESEAPLRVLIVEDHEAIARGLELLLRREGIEIAGSARSLSDAKRLLQRRAVDVIVLDVVLGEENGLEFVPLARGRGAKVLLYTGSTDAAALTAAASAGADGVAGKSGSPTEFVAAVQAVARGEGYHDTSLKPSDTPPPATHVELTAREREVVSLLARGLSGRDIARELYLSPDTVRTHLRNAMNRTGANTRAHLIAITQ